MPEISIIIPVYNTEAHIETCIKSILEQTFTDFECIIVDDGSTDNAIALVKAMTGEDDRFKVFQHTQNRGQGIARNTGIAKAKGAYISFIDSDDYVHRDFLKILYDLIKKYQAKISICNIVFVSESNTQITWIKNHLSASNSHQAIIHIFKEKGLGVVVNRLYKKELFDNVKFPTGKYEDTPFLIAMLIENEVGEVPYTDKPLYNYLMREGSTTKTVNNNQMDDFINNSIINIQQLLKQSQDCETLQEAYYRYWHWSIILGHISTFPLYSASPVEDILLFLGKLEKHNLKLNQLPWLILTDRIRLESKKHRALIKAMLLLFGRAGIFVYSQVAKMRSTVCLGIYQISRLPRPSILK